jgi:hypothetical protein
LMVPPGIGAAKFSRAVGLPLSGDCWFFELDQLLSPDQFKSVAIDKWNPVRDLAFDVSFQRSLS